jgi:selenocysteine lyase/cysteine desulfurase
MKETELSHGCPDFPKDSDRRGKRPKKKESDSEFTRRELLTDLGPGMAALGVLGLMSEAFPEEETDLNSLAKEPLGSIHKQFLLEKNLAYMNNGSLGPCPAYVLQETMKAWRELETNPVSMGYGPFIKKMEEVRGKAAAFLGCALEELAITSCTTESMNMVAQGLELQPGDHVLTTDHEHAGGAECWRYYAKRRGVIIDKVKLPFAPSGVAELVELFRKGLTQKTKVISVSHVTFTTGLRLPIAQISELARSQGCSLVVDGAQGPGAMRVNVNDLGCDTYATSAHKWMLAPKGTGLLYIRKESQKQIVPMALAHGFRAYTGAVGTRNIPTIMGLGYAIDFLNSIGPQRIEEYSLSLRKHLFDSLQGIEGIKVVSSPFKELASPLVSVALPDGFRNSTVAADLQSKHGVVVKVLSGPVRNGLRISTHVYNTRKDVERLCSGLRQVLG